jgi:hypothetical protein
LRILPAQPHLDEAAKLRRRRTTEGFNLAFLDIMSCGLGAIVLVLMLVKHNVEHVSPESERLEGDLARLEAVETDLGSKIVALLQVKAATAGEIAAREAALARIRSDLTRARDELAARERAARALEKTIETTEVAPKEPDVIEDRRVGEENYIVGLRVEGARIGILVDASASMTDEWLIDIIRRKNQAAPVRQAGPKWDRTRRVVRWLLARAPAQSQVAAVAFAAKPTWLGDAGGARGGDGTGLGRIAGALDSVVPGGPTNLAAGLAALRAHKPTNVYIITDGLPTAGDSGYRSISPFADCSALWGGSTTISGECRKRLFRHTVANANLGAATVNVVLLPIEGDPAASHEFWRWTADTGGILIAPAASWP